MGFDDTHDFYNRFSSYLKVSLLIGCAFNTSRLEALGLECFSKLIKRLEFFLIK